MNKKIERDLYGPGWIEVILGALLSLVLGVVLAAVFLMLKPVAVVKELPKEPEKDLVYFVQGSRDSAKARQASAKQKVFGQGGSVVVNEDELNALTAPPAPKPGVKPAPAAESKMLATGAPDFRIRNSVFQAGVPVTISAAGLQHEVIVQARGGFEKTGEWFVFKPTEFYVGSCPIQRLPGVQDALMKRFVGMTKIPDELVSAWQKLADVSVEGSTLRLAVP